MIACQKYNGLGNSFLFFSEFFHDLSVLKEYKSIVSLCDPGHGLGADGVVFVSRASEIDSDCKMQVFNSDGTEAEMCGNAVRAVADFYRQLYPAADIVNVQTLAGNKSVVFKKNGKYQSYYSVNMGFAQECNENEVILGSQRTPIVYDEQVFEPFYVDVGNPHAVLFLNEKYSKSKLETLGSFIENHPNHPNRINVEFVNIISETEVDVSVWERGCGLTQACGTGAVAVVFAGIEQNKLQKKVRVQMPGGTLIIEKDQNGIMYMTGPVLKVADFVLYPSFVGNMTSNNEGASDGL